MNKLTDRVRDLFSKTHAIQTKELSKSVIEHDRFDDNVLSDLTDRALHFRTARYNKPEIDVRNMTDDEGNPIEVSDEQAEQAESYMAWEDLFSDTFRALHTLDGPELKSKEDILPSRELNHRIQQQLAYTEKFQKLRSQTRHDGLGAAFAAIHLADGLRDALEDELKEFVVRANEMEKMEQELRDMPPDPNAPPGPGGQQPDPNAPAQPDPNAQQRQELAQQLQDLANQQQNAGLGNNVIEAVEDAVDDANDAADAISSLPGTQPGEGKTLTPDEMLDLANEWRNNPELQEIAAMVGRMKRDLRYRRSNRVIGGREEIVDVKNGNDLPLLLPHEKVKLMDEDYELDFFRRYYERALMEYETQGYAEAGRGPIIIAIDGSGSMSGMENVWARAVSLAFISVAKREKRDAAAVEFSSTGQVQRWDFMAKELTDPRNILDFASHFFGGGTDITTGVESAKELIDSVPEFKTADIVVMTDGHDYYQEDDEALKNELTARGVRLHGVAIGAESNEYLEEMCETVVSAWDLAGSNEATKHLAEAIS